MWHSLHDIAPSEAERLNPGGKHAVVSVEVDGDPAEPGDARVVVHSRVPLDADEIVDISVTAVKLSEADE